MHEKEEASPADDDGDPREDYLQAEDLFYWMERDEERGLEPLSYLGTYFPQGCRFCM